DGIADPPRHDQGRRRARRRVQGGRVPRLQPEAGPVGGDPGPDLPGGAGAGLGAEPDRADARRFAGGRGGSGGLPARPAARSGALLHGVRLGRGERPGRAVLLAAAAAGARPGRGGRAAGVVVAGAADRRVDPGRLPGRRPPPGGGPAARAAGGRRRAPLADRRADLGVDRRRHGRDRGGALSGGARAPADRPGGGAAALGHTRSARPRSTGRSARWIRPARAWQVATDFSGDAGARATRSLLTAAPPERPTAIVYDNDIMAVAGLSVAAEMGLRVPDDVSLLAWDDSQLCRLTHPTLSAMSHDVHGFGADVARTLFEVITGEGPGSHPVPTPVLTPRGSTAPPKV
ncbi:LOW QUALITY PROTEIN: transcriptional regulator, partial [Streptomyces viridosporus ATCC 14672]